MAAFFDWFFKPGPPIKPPKPRPPQLGYTVSQGEYDALKAECDRAHETAARLSREHDEIIQLVSLYAYKIGMVRQPESLTETIRNVLDLIHADHAIIKRLSMEQEQLTEQLDNERRTHREREAALLMQLTDARTALEAAKARANKKKIPVVAPVEEEES